MEPKQRFQRNLEKQSDLVLGSYEIITPSSAERGKVSTKSHPEEAELPVRRRWMHGLLRGRFTRGGAHSRPWTPLRERKTATFYKYFFEKTSVS